MKKQFKIYEFSEKSEDCYEGYRPVTIKVSKKAEKLSLKSQQLFVKHNKVVDELFRELQKDNPDMDFSDFIGDDFAIFTGQVMN